jgi:hypothetical protein
VNLNKMPRDADGNPISAPAFEDTGGLAPQWEGHLRTATADSINIYDEVVTTEKRIRGGWYELLDDNAAIGDIVEFSVVDKDDVLGLFTMLGLTEGEDVLELRKYVRTEYVNPASVGRQMFQGQSAFVVMAGLYLRSIYESTGSSDVQFKVVTLAYE